MKAIFEKTMEQREHLIGEVDETGVARPFGERKR